MDTAAPLRVLAVDDDARGLARLSTLLRWDGHQTTTAESFESARRQLREQRFDLLVTKLRLEAYNGLHLVLYGRTFSPHTACIIVMSENDPATESEAARLGAGVLVGSVEPTRLRTLLTSVLENRLLRAEGLTLA